MSEIKTIFTKEKLEQYARDNQLDVLNVTQISAKFMELEARIEQLESQSPSQRT